jgi:hypothetical protein
MTDQNPPVVIGTTISQGTVNQDSNRYSVTVPPGFYEGDIFNIGIGSRMLSVRFRLKISKSRIISFHKSVYMYIYIY